MARGADGKAICSQGEIFGDVCGVDKQGGEIAGTLRKGKS